MVLYSLKFSNVSSLYVTITLELYIYHSRTACSNVVETAIQTTIIFICTTERGRRRKEEERATVGITREDGEGVSRNVGDRNSRPA